MSRPLAELAIVFFKLGATSFGGPAAHIALMEDEVVRRQKWLDHDEFLDLLGATNLIPGPNSTEMALHIGRVRCGWKGLIVAGVASIAPAFACVLALSYVYVRYGTRPEISLVLDGVKPVMLAIVLQALVRLGRVALARPRAWVFGMAAFGLALAFSGQDVWILLGAGIVSLLAERLTGSRPRDLPRLSLLALGAPAAVGVVAGPVTSGGLFLVFFKIGATLFGSGYVLLSFLRTDLVLRLGWLSEGQLLDAVAVGQVTPGPLFTSATFVGYLLAGFPGAVAATVGIFLPAFLLVALSGPLVERLRRSSDVRAFLDGVNASAVALMAVVTLELFQAAAADRIRLLVFVASTATLLLTKINSAWLILAGGLIGLVRSVA